MEFVALIMAMETVALILAMETVALILAMETVALILAMETGDGHCRIGIGARMTIYHCRKIIKFD